LQVNPKKLQRKRNEFEVGMATYSIGTSSYNYGKTRRRHIVLGWTAFHYTLKKTGIYRMRFGKAKDPTP
jgi:hypothetical protein